MSNLALILAAGKGTRMNSPLPKCLHPVAGAPMVVHVIAQAAEAGLDQRIVVTGHGGPTVDKVVTDFDANATTVAQTEQLGTGHAVLQAIDAIKSTDGIAVVLYGDSPLIQADTINALIERATATNGPVILGFDTPNPAKYGRLLTDGDKLLAIREAKDATPEELAITLCNSGVLACPASILSEILPRITNDNAAGEYYLTDVIELARYAGYDAGFIIGEEIETQGVNTPADLRAVNHAYQNQRRDALLAQGISMPAPETVFFNFDTLIGNDVTIEANVVFAEGVSVENNVTIRAFSHLEGAHIGEGSVVGPFARLRPGSELGENVKIGNFVETKNAVLAKGAKVNHLSYVGDAEVGENTNIGAGVITANYDGVFKHRTTIGRNVFIGTNSSLIAPVSIGDDAMTAAGSVITDDVDDSDLAIGRARQENKKGLAKRLMDSLRYAKARKN